MGLEPTTFSLGSWCGLMLLTVQERSEADKRWHERTFRRRAGGQKQT